MGDGFAEDTEFGPLNNSMQFEKVQGEPPTEISSLPSGLWAVRAPGSQG